MSSLLQHLKPCGQFTGSTAAVAFCKTWRKRGTKWTCKSSQCTHVIQLWQRWSDPHFAMTIHRKLSLLITSMGQFTTPSSRPDCPEQSPAHHFGCGPIQCEWKCSQRMYFSNYFAVQNAIVPSLFTKRKIFTSLLIFHPSRTNWRTADATVIFGTLISLEQVALVFFVFFWSYINFILKLVWFIFWYLLHKLKMEFTHFVRSTGKSSHSFHNLIMEIIYYMTKRFGYTFIKEQIALKVYCQLIILRSNLQTSGNLLTFQSDDIIQWMLSLLWGTCPGGTCGRLDLRMQKWQSTRFSTQCKMSKMSSESISNMTSDLQPGLLPLIKCWEGQGEMFQCFLAS